MSKRCFVVQGFGKKQDYEQGKQFDLDASYEVIKEAVEEAGLECYRGDELGGALIDQVMYDELLDADLVIADITTLNFNAAYELGVRYALRPFSTVVVAERGINFPFDISHVYIHPYEHLGQDIGHREAKRFRKYLREVVEKTVDASQKDSPVYKFLDRLPARGYIDQALRERARKGRADAGSSLRDIVDQAKAAMREERFTDAIERWQEARDAAGKNDYIVQQLALATYKSKKPSPLAALEKAREILEYLKPRGSFDPETLGLWAAVHKRTFEATGEPGALDEALFALERGFFIKGDYYNGINLAFMLDTKATTAGATDGQELHAVARYVRRKVKRICERDCEDPELSPDDRYWILATAYEACVGLDEEEEALRWKAESEKVAKADWMAKSTGEQVAKLRKVLGLAGAGGGR